MTAEVSLIDKDSATIKSSLASQEIMGLPVGQEYRDLQKLIPGVQFSQDQVRGPSAGGSGQDNVYQFDGVNVNLPLFGTLSAEPASHDIAEVTVVKGGARAVDFDRSGGFSIDTVSRSGTSDFHGQVGYQFQSDAMSADLDSGEPLALRAEPRLADRQPRRPHRQGLPLLLRLLLPPDPGPGQPVQPLRGAARLREHAQRGLRQADLHPDADAPPERELPGLEARRHRRPLRLERLAHHRHGERLPAQDLHRRRLLGRQPLELRHLQVHPLREPDLGHPGLRRGRRPQPHPGHAARRQQPRHARAPHRAEPVSGQPAYNAFIQPLIDRYGYSENGVQTGGGIVGYGWEFNDQDFFRDAAQIGYNLTLGTSVRHELHAGYQWYQDEEELVRSSNGWGLISVPGGRLTAPIAGNPQRAYYTARIQQQSTGQAVPIKSRYRSQSIELNDTIKWSNWTFNLGVLFSNDTLYGQGLREDSSTLSGYVAAPGNRYKMYELGWGDMIQPRVSATWAYNSKDTVYGGWARYNPAASSLPRAASWDRNLTGLFVDAHFDQNGVLFGSVPVGSSSGKLFVDDMTPRTTDEFLLGTAKQLGQRWSARLYGRYRESRHFWEDTNNNARVAYNPPPDIPRELYIPDLTAQLAQIGSGSSYVIAELDGAYTKFWEATLETEYRSDKTYVRASYTWSKYYGNFDQDNSTTATTQNIFIGSSNIADAAGRQLWDFRDGDAARRPAAPAQGVRHPPAAVEGVRRRLLRRPVRSALGDVELRALHQPDHVHQRHEPLRGGGRLAPLRLPLAARRQLHAELPLRQAPQPAAPRGRLQRLRQPDRLQHRAGLPQLGLRHCRGPTSPRCACSWPPACSSDARLTSRRPGGLTPPGLLGSLIS